MIKYFLPHCKLKFLLSSWYAKTASACVEPILHRVAQLPGGEAHTNVIHPLESEFDYLIPKR